MESELTLIADRLEKDRESLLDMTLRNPLLNYRTLKGRGVDISGEHSGQVYDTLVTQGKAMSFSPSRSEDESVEANRPDLVLQTPHTKADLDRRLLNTYYVYRSFIEEQGVNALCIAFGMLKWREPKDERELVAPLVLVPVELERTNVRELFRVKYSDEDVTGNESLRVRLNESYSIKLPEWLPDTEGPEGATDADEEPGNVLDAYLAEVARAVEGKPGFAVDTAPMALGLFSFAKYRMYVDLDESRRGDDFKLARNPLISSLLTDGFDARPPQPYESQSLDDYLEPATTFHVVDADGSQSTAILDAASSPALVIQGPPGTGKSQTITNIIADAVAHKRTVLFVAEKLAALEVVKRRMDQCGLGQLCLELHSNKARKADVLAELDRTLNMDSPSGGGAVAGEHDGAAAGARLTQLRAALNDYCDAVNHPVGDSGVSPYLAYGLIEQAREALGSAADALLLPEQAGDWSAADISQRRAAVRDLADAIADAGALDGHPFACSRLTSATPAQVAAIPVLLQEASAANERASTAIDALSQQLGMASSDTARAIDELLAAAGRCCDFPLTPPLNLTAPAWASGHPAHAALAELVAGSERIAAAVESLPDLPASAWRADIAGIRAVLHELAPKWYAGISGRYRAALRAYADAVGGSSTLASAPIDAKLRVVDTMAGALEGAAGLASAGSSAAIGMKLPQQMEDWPAAARALRAAAQLHADVEAGRAPAAVVAFLAGSPDVEALRRLLDSAASAMAARAAAAQSVMDALSIDVGCPGAITPSLSFAGLAGSLAQLEAARGRLLEIVALNAQLEKVRDLGMPELAAAAASWPATPAALADVFELSLATRLVDRAFVQRPALLEFRRSAHDRAVADFGSVDVALIEANRTRVAAEHYAGLPKTGNAGAIATLRREMRKKRRHMPIRRLMLECGTAIQRIKPVFMMSPLSVATFLEAGAVQFDIVVFDEASQLKPVDAFGAIARGKSAVVVGDSRQLPPTSFFDAIVAGEAYDDDPDAGSSTDIESILGMFEAKGADSRMLSWHYRSRHESLIAVSNSEFYDSKLVVFPSPDRSRAESGLAYRFVDGVYDRGGRRINKTEAEVVARAVMEHARTAPGMTLGVATFSIPQMEAVRDEIERLRRADPESDAFFGTHPHEPFFVKNLENVQGDERDVIFISVGYGKDENGQVTMNFGPLNKDGGERRLNVLITRARSRCVVFTNLHSGDIDINVTGARGVAAFKSFLYYAEAGADLDAGVGGGSTSGGRAASPFEAEVAAELASCGYEVVHGVGSSGLRVDIGVIDPAQPGRYLLGVMCDGPSYHDSRWARDRDRLRGQVLRGKGWTIHRIWSTDWYRSHEQAVAALAAAVDEAMRGRVPAAAAAAGASEAAEPEPASGLGLGEGGAPAPQQPEAATVEGDSPAAEPKPVQSHLTAEPYVVARFEADTQGLALPEVPVNVLADWVIRVVEVEGPVHIDEVCRRVVENAGGSKMGSRISDAVREGARAAIRRKRVAVNSGFLRLAGEEGAAQTGRIRNRAELAPASRKIEFVPDGELRMALEAVITESCGIDAAGAATQVARLIGFGRATDAIRERVEAIVAQMLEDGSLEERGGTLLVATAGGAV